MPDRCSDECHNGICLQGKRPPIMHRLAYFLVFQVHLQDWRDGKVAFILLCC